MIKQRYSSFLVFIILVPLLILNTAAVGITGTPSQTPQQTTMDESIALPGLDGEVTVKYDSFGIPHIYATTTHDLFMAQGFFTARDRWWQMEWNRHQAAGRLSEIMGDNLVGIDTFLRTAGLARNAQHDYDLVSEAGHEVLDSYTAGVNVYLDSIRDDPGAAVPEYNFANLLGAQLGVEDWTPYDSLAYGQAVAFLFTQSFIESELLKSGLIAGGGPLAPLLLMPEYDYDKLPLVSEPGWQAQTARAAEGVAALQTSSLDSPDMPVFSRLPFPTFADTGSNSWVVSGKLTDTGMPLLANDPHIDQSTPSIWYEIGLHCVEVSAACPYDVYGYTIAGIPPVIIGHNEHLAWGMTVNSLDMLDMYTIQVNPDNPLQYMYDGEWVDMDVINETIQVAGGDPVEIQVHNTRFGPIVTHLLGIDTPMAMHATFSGGTTGVDALTQIDRATNWDEFQAGVAKFDLAAQNFIYGDVEGNIGVVAGGKAPIRAAGQDGTLPVDGSSSANEWQGFVDPMKNPRLFNPDAGYIVAANNAFIRPEALDFVFGVYFNYGQRAGRIETLLQATPVHSVDSFVSIQNDTFNPAAAIVIPVLSEIDFGDETLNAARDWLADWNFMNDADSGQALLFNAFWMKLMPLAFDEMEPAGGVNGGSTQMYIMANMIHGAHPLWNNPALGTNDRDTLLKMALQQGWDMLVERLGDDTSTWRWDTLHVSSPRHTPFGQLPSGVNPGLDIVLNDINRLFNRHYGVAGGLESVNNQRWDAREGNFTLSGSIVSMRMIVDFSNLDNSHFVHELGQSGNPFSPHYDDMSALWANGQYHPYGFTPDAVDAITTSTLTLLPE